MVIEWVRPYPAVMPKDLTGKTDRKLTALYSSQNRRTITVRTFVGNLQGMGETAEQAQIEAMTLSRGLSFACGCGRVYADRYFRYLELRS